MEEFNNNKVNIKDNSKELDHFASTILEQMTNLKKKLNNNDKQLRFSPTIMRMALSLWSKSNSAYRELLESSLLILPSESTLKENRNNLSVHEGYCPKKYSTFYDEFVNKKTNSSIGLNDDKVHGHVMCDEMKLKDGILFNCQSNGMVGFTCSGNSLDLKSELRQFFKGDDEKPDNFNSEKEIHKPATYVNQWRFRSIYNETRTIEFFYNSGSLPGDELMKQLFNIL